MILRYSYSCATSHITIINWTQANEYILNLLDIVLLMEQMIDYIWYKLSSFSGKIYRATLCLQNCNAMPVLFYKIHENWLTSETSKILQADGECSTPLMLMHKIRCNYLCPKDILVAYRKIEGALVSLIACSATRPTSNVWPWLRAQQGKLSQVLGETLHGWATWKLIW